MSDSKKTSRPKFISTKDINMSDILNESQFEKPAPKKRGPKRQKPEINEDEEDISKLIGIYQANTKKKRCEDAFDSKESREKLLNVLGQQMEARRGMHMNFLQGLQNVAAQMETDHDTLKENDQKLEQLAGVFLKCIKQTGSAQKQNMKALRDLHGEFKKEVEGLITRGAMKPDDRPLWFDVYRKFPPIAEPKFARPKPEIKPIRQILYPEDSVRAKFHAAGQGLGAVNMLSPVGDSHTKKLVQQYEKLKSEGVPEPELIEKSVAAIGQERQERIQDTFKITPKNPDSATAQVLAEADLKNIFKDQ